MPNPARGHAVHLGAAELYLTDAAVHFDAENTGEPGADGLVGA